jgi:hypothetical protein
MFSLSSARGDDVMASASRLPPNVIPGLDPGTTMRAVAFRMVPGSSPMGAKLTAPGHNLPVMARLDRAISSNTMSRVMARSSRTMTVLQGADEPGAVNLAPMESGPGMTLGGKRVLPGPLYPTLMQTARALVEFAVVEPMS